MPAHQASRFFAALGALWEISFQFADSIAPFHMRR